MSKKFEIIGNNLFQCRVCTSLTEEEALQQTRKENPAGTSNNWQQYDYKEEPKMKPIPCADDPKTHKHYVFVC